MARHPYIMFPIRNLQRNKLRSLLLIVGVSLTVALQIGIAISVDSLIYDFEQQQRNHNYTDLTVHGKEPLTLTEAKILAPKIAALNGIEKVAPATILTLTPFVDEQQLSPKAIFYATTSSHPDFDKVDLNDGKRTLESNSVLVSESIARILRVEVGSQFTLDANDKYGFSGATFKVSGIIVDTYPFGNLFEYPSIIVDIDYFENLFSNTTFLEFYAAASVKNLVRINDLSIQLSDQFPDYYIVREKYIDELRASGLDAYRIAMNLLVLASYLIEFLFITNIFAIIMKERSKEFGILRAIGTSQKQIGIFILGEIFIIGLVGAILGIIFGTGLAMLLLAIFKYYLKFTTLSALILEPSTMLLSIVTGVIVTVLSGLYPLIIAARQPIVQNIHTLTEQKKKRKIITWQSSLIFGIVCIITGSLLQGTVKETSFLGFDLVSPQSAVVVLIMVGALAIEGALISFVPKIGVKILTRRNVASLLIGIKEVERELQKSTIIIFTAALSLTFILVVGMISAGLLEGVPVYYEDSFGDNIDIVIETWDHLEFPKNFSDSLKSNLTYMIDQATYLQEQRVSLSIGAHVFFFGVNATEISYFFDEFIQQPQNQSLTSLLNVTTHGVVVSDVIADRLGVTIGDKLIINLETENTTDVVVSGMVEGNPFIHGGEYFFISTALFEQFFHKTTSKWFMSDINPDYPIVDAGNTVAKYYPSLKAVRTTYDYISMITYSLSVQGAFVHLIFIHSFLLSGLTQFIGILISTLKMEREVAIMRALGLSKESVFKLFLSEAAVLGISGVALGIVNSIIGSDLLAWYISQSIPIEVAINSLREQFLYFLWIVVSLLVTFASAWVPSKRASQTNIIAAISGRKDMEDALGLYEEVTFDVKKVIETINTPQVIQNDEKEIEDSEIQSLIEEVLRLSKDLDLSNEENKQWHDLFESQHQKFQHKEIDKRKFHIVLNRYLRYLRN
ncbi:MAG: ABC transporter permease [Candidatus Hodarchaeales archaeon]